MSFLLWSCATTPSDEDVPIAEESSVDEQPIEPAVAAEEISPNEPLESAPPPVAPESTSPESGLYLYTLGSIAASNLYTTYAMLGAVADGYAARAYNVTTAYSLTEESIALSSNARNIIQRVIETGYASEKDTQILITMSEAYALLVNQAQGLLSFIEDATQKEDFTMYRALAWQKIIAILGADDSTRPIDILGQ